jgi:hypothetical protein
MKRVLILKIIGTLHTLAGLLLFSIILISNDVAATFFSLSPESVSIFKTPLTVVASMNLGLGSLLIISSRIRDTHYAKFVLLGQVAMMFCILFGALFNHFSSITAIDPPAPLWVMIILNLSFSLYGYFKGE